LKNASFGVKPKGRQKWVLSVFDVPHPSVTSDAVGTDTRRLSEADAIDIWIARWLRIRSKDLIQRYRCDPRRLYEIWEGARFPASREKAWALLQTRHPGLADRVDPGNHKRLPRTSVPKAHPSLFDFKP
jgi:hypothetical protein